MVSFGLVSVGQSLAREGIRIARGVAGDGQCLCINFVYPCTNSGSKRSFGEGRGTPTSTTETTLSSGMDSHPMFVYMLQYRFFENRFTIQLQRTVVTEAWASPAPPRKPVFEI